MKTTMSVFTDKHFMVTTNSQSEAELLLKLSQPLRAKTVPPTSPEITDSSGETVSK